MNLISGHLEHNGKGPSFRGPGFVYALPAALSHLPPAPVTLGLRPEHLTLQSQDGDVQAAIRLVEPLGKDTLLYFDYGGDKPLIVIVEGTRPFRTGERLELAFDPKRLYLFDANGQRLQ